MRVSNQRQQMQRLRGQRKLQANPGFHNLQCVSDVESGTCLGQQQDKKILAPSQAGGMGPNTKLDKAMQGSLPQSMPELYFREEIPHATNMSFAS